MFLIIFVIINKDKYNRLIEKIRYQTIVTCQHAQNHHNFKIRLMKRICSVLT